MNDANLTPEAKAVLDTILNRRSYPYKRLKPEPVPQETVMQLLEAANRAPTHRFTEPWRFNVFTGEAKRHLANALIEAYQRQCGSEAKEAKIAKTLERCLHVPVVINIFMARDEKPLLPEFEEILAVGCAMQNLHLAAYALNLSGLWSTPGYLDDPQLNQFLGIAGEAKNFGFFYLGYIDGEFPRSKRKPIEDKVRWVQA